MVSRDFFAAVGTDVLARGEVFGDPAEAPVTDLSRPPWVDEDSVLAERICLEGCLSGEAAPRCIRDGFCEAVILKHP